MKLKFRSERSLKINLQSIADHALVELYRCPDDPTAPAL
jgi:hypothetical protein